MALSLGLLISLGFTTLLCVLLFFYIRQRTASIDNKLTSLFSIVQEEANKRNNTSSMVGGSKTQDVSITEVEDVKRSVAYNGGNHTMNQPSQYSDVDDDDDDVSVIEEDNDLISVSGGSEDEYDDEDDDDDDDDDNDNNKNGDIKIIRNVDVNIDEYNTTYNDIENDLLTFTGIVKSSAPDNEPEMELEQEPEQEPELELVEDDLEEVEYQEVNELDEDVEHDTNRENEKKDVIHNNYENEDNDNEDSKQINNVQDEVYDDVQDDVNIDVNVKKLSVTHLRELVQQKNLHENPKKLKKPQLLELLHV